MAASSRKEWSEPAPAVNIRYSFMLRLVRNGSVDGGSARLLLTDDEIKEHEEWLLAHLEEITCVQSGVQLILLAGAGCYKMSFDRCNSQKHIDELGQRVDRVSYFINK